MSKPECIQVLATKDGPANVEWKTPEWASPDSQALVAYAQGLELEIGPSAEFARKWDWACKLTAELSETPEILDSGTRSSVNGAKIAASNPANKYLRERYKNRPKPQVAKNPVADPKDMPAENAVERVEQALAAQMATKIQADGLSIEQAASKRKVRKAKAESPKEIVAEQRKRRNRKPPVDAPEAVAA
jgi:hypothetical protein